jgi:hypothetical protein
VLSVQKVISRILCSTFVVSGNFCLFLLIFVTSAYKTQNKILISIDMMLL